ncbi:hypothetical protein FJZ18_04040 [Candidatus Pacearchaeota archaeon]|nr:hypothetical protein [Candidatus Pacearchaeota archaeon]
MDKGTRDKIIDLRRDLSTVLNQLIVVELNNESRLYVDNFNPDINSFIVGSIKNPPNQTKAQRNLGPLRSVRSLAGYLIEYTISAPYPLEHDRLIISPSPPLENEPTHIGCIHIPYGYVKQCKKA